MTYMAYLDITSGFAKLIDETEKNQQRTSTESSPDDYKVRRDDIFNFFKSISQGQGKDIPAKYAKICTINEIKVRNSYGGRNQWFFANMCVVWIYQCWEDHYRKQIAKSLGCSINEVISPVFGDVRKLRNAIIHNLGVATSELEKTEVITPFKQGIPLYLNENHLRALVENIHTYLDTLIYL